MTATTPQLIPGNVLDFYLSQGYYRMYQNLFTCQLLPLDAGLYTVHWLRLVLERVQYGPDQRRLLRQNERFGIVRRPFRLTAEYEELYARYRQSVDFDAPETIAGFMLADADHNRFPSAVIELRDGPRLIALGIFDLGEDSLAGIMNFYDPAYRKHSLGKYLMLLKIDYARRQGLRYYYPGYLLQGYPKFDYKLFPCLPATEVFDSMRGRWLPYSRELVAAHSAELLAAWEARDEAAPGLDFGQ